MDNANKDYPLITGHTRLLAVIGNPVRHSLSPQIHNTFSRLAGLPYVYMAFPVSKGDVRHFFHAASLLDIAGFNVTMPLKEECAALVDTLTEEAKTYGAVNTVVRQNGEFTGHNTDAGGFLKSLSDIGRPVQGTSVLILGAGGAAKSVGTALHKCGARVSFCARQSQKAAAILPDVPIWAFEHLGEACRGVDILVNCTPLGMSGSGDFQNFDFLQALPKEALIYDLIYAPRKTTLLTQAEFQGFITCNGLAHLVNQAALSFALFTGVMPPRDVTVSLMDTL